MGKPILSKSNKMSTSEKIGWIIVIIAAIVVFGFILHPSGVPHG